MLEVSKAHFFAIMGPRNVHPRLVAPNYSDWETPSGMLLGRSYPGWSNPGDPARYLVVGYLLGDATATATATRATAPAPAIAPHIVRPRSRE